LIKQSNDPTRDVETVARLMASRDVAVNARSQLKGGRSPNELLASVEAAPVAQSNIVSVTAKGSSAKEAAATANAFARGLVTERTSQLHRALDQKIAGLQADVRQQTAQEVNQPGGLRSQLSQLETLRQGPDPSVRVQTLAAEPSGPASPKPLLTIAAGLIAGLTLGLAGAFALFAVDPRLRREEQLRERYRLPVLARIPRETKAPRSRQGERRFVIGPHRKVRQPLSPGSLSPPTMEAFRTLRAMLDARTGSQAGPRSILVTGPSPSEGKSTTAVNLAASFALAGRATILIEADFRRPTLGTALDLRNQVGAARVLLGNARLESALVPVRPFGDQLRVLMADPSGEALPELLSLPAASSLLERAEELADVVVIDSPPLTEVVDALPLARQADDLVVVVRLDATRLPQLDRLGDLLSQSDITPAGFVLVGVGSSEQSSYYFDAQRERMLYRDGDGGSSEPSGARAGTGSR
jgi:non-specific protein-tyrosine kinase